MKGTTKGLLVVWLFLAGLITLLVPAQRASAVQPGARSLPQTSGVIPRSSWTIKYVDSQETSSEDGKASNAIDGNTATIWHTRWSTTNDPLPHEIQIDMAANYNVNALRYLPRLDGGINGRIAKYEIYVSLDGTNWGTAVATGSFTNDANEQQVNFTAKNGRYLRLRALTEVNGNPWTSVAEINALGGITAGPTVSATPSTTTAGGTVTVSWSGVSTPSVTDWIGLYTPGTANSPSIKWLYTGSCSTAAGTTAKASGSCSVTMPTTAGSYEFRLFSNNTYTRLATSSTISVTSSNGPTLAVSATSVGTGGNITVSWSGISSPTVKDWITLTVPAAPNESVPLKWLYTSSCTTTEGTSAKTSGSCTFSMPSKAGIYEFRLFTNGSYTLLTKSAMVNVGNASTAPSFTVKSFSLRYALQGTAYSDKISFYARDPNGNTTITYSKVSGPSWLSISSAGALSGTPGTADVGVNTFSIRVTDNTGQTDSATMTIKVFQPGTQKVDQLKVMSYNIWHATNDVNNGYNKGIDSILVAGADIIGFQEAYYTLATRYADEMGWYAYNPGQVAILSRYPIMETFTATYSHGFGARIRLAANPVQDVILWSAWLAAYPYGPYSACKDGASVSKIVSDESGHLSEIRSVLSAMSGHLANADTIPVFLVGDFNVPSHLDWTSAAASHNCGYVVSWPVSQEVAGKGLIDSFRTIHPDPAQTPADTWSPVFKNGEPQDRIDYVYFKSSKLTVVNSQIFTMPVEKTDTGYENNTWPSDHASVVSTFTLK